MNYTLFDEYITLQALLKEIGIIQSGGAAKAFLQDISVFFNDELEKRRGKKVRVGDHISIPEMEIDLYLTAPTEEELLHHQAEKAEKKRVAQLVKEMNKQASQKKIQTKKHTSISPKKKKKIHFPGA